MKRFKGTKGKWRANELSVYDEKGFEVAEMPYPYRIKENWDKIANHWGEKKGVTCVDVSDEETIANAQLIATAPELLEALIAMIDIVDSTSGLTGWHMNGDIAYWEEFRDVDIARDVINKALGYD